MIRATIIDPGDQQSYGVYLFAVLPSHGDTIVLDGPAGIEVVRVEYIEHYPVKVDADPTVGDQIEHSIHIFVSFVAFGEDA